MFPVINKMIYHLSADLTLRSNPILSYLRPNASLSYTPFPDDLEGCKIEWTRRAKIVADFVGITGFRARVDPVKIVEMEIAFGSLFDDGVAVTSTRPTGLKANSFHRNAKMLVPFSFAIDFAKDFQVKTIEELKQRLNTYEGLKAFSDKLCYILVKSDLSTDKEKMRLIVQNNKDVICAHIQKYIEAPLETYYEGLFGILHEFGHIQNNDASVRKQFPLILISLIIAVIASLPVTLPLLGIPILASSGVFILDIALRCAWSCLSWKVLFTAKRILVAQFIGRAQEIAADRFAASAFSGEIGKRVRQGGIEGFRFDSRWSPKIETSYLARIWKYLARAQASHPPDEERIKMLESFEENNLHLLQPVLSGS